MGSLRSILKQEGDMSRLRFQINLSGHGLESRQEAIINPR